MKHILLNNLGNNITKENFFIKKFNENMAWKLFPGPS